LFFCEGTSGVGAFQ